MKHNFIILFLLFCMFCFENTLGQPAENGNKTANFKYISPRPGSKYIMPSNTIALRQGDKLDKVSFAAFELQVSGSLSGTIEGKVVLSDDERTLLFYPEQPFRMGERVYVKSAGLLETDSDLLLQPVEFFFDVTAQLPEMPENYTLDQEFSYHPAHFSNHHSNYMPVNKPVMDNNLPEDFPDLTVEVLNERYDNGYYFVSPFGHWGYFPDNTPYLIAFDDMAVPVYYKKRDEHAYEFKLNVTGQLSYLHSDWPNSYYNVMDSSYKVVDQFSMQNGYPTDFHEFFITENGHAFLMAYDPQLVDMSQVVPGGLEDAVVIGWVIQEQDTAKNVVFQWRSWDHYNILDAEGYVDLLGQTIDLVHGNSIEVTPDGEALLLSARNLNEITKVDRNTGSIIWRLNGNNNMFEFINDTLTFSWQHDCRVLENGNISIFDNGTHYPEPQFSSMVEYTIDTTNMTATLVRRLRNDPDIFGEVMGSSREVANGNIVVGWGSGIPGITEFNEAGEMTASYYFAGINYRAYRHHWTTNYFETDQQNLDFDTIWKEDQVTKSIVLTNNQDVDIAITSYHTHTEPFYVENEFPVVIPAGDTISIQVTFNPAVAGTFTDRLTLNSDIDTADVVQRIAQQVELAGYATEGQSVGEQHAIRVLASPNPAGDQLKLVFGNRQEQITIQVRNALGETVLTEKHAGCIQCTIDMGQLSSGLYFVRVYNAENQSSAVLKVLKD